MTFFSAVLFLAVWSGSTTCVTATLIPQGRQTYPCRSLSRMCLVLTASPSLTGRTTPPKTSKKLQKMVSRINLSQLLSNWKELGFNKAAIKNIEKDITVARAIIEERNSVMHRGSQVTLSYRKCWSYVRSVDRILTESEKIMPETVRGLEGKSMAKTMILSMKEMK